MPRIRSIKPELWADEALARLPRDARLLFIGMLNFADDEGRLRGNPLLIRAQVFPYEPDLDVGALLDALAEGGFILKYETEGQSYLWVRNFEKHQKIEKPSPSKLPPPPAKKPRRAVGEGSPTPPRIVGVGVGGDRSSGSEEGSGEDAPRDAAALQPPPPPVQIEVQVPPAPTPATPFVAFVVEHWPDVRNPADRQAEWADACPAVDLLQEAKRALAWERETPAHRKVDHGKFLGNWFRHSQDDANKRGPRRPAPGASIRISEESKREAETPGRKVL
jgi:hypothetical protein